MNELINVFSLIFNACMQLLTSPITVFGITFDLFGVLVFVSLGSLLWWLVTSIFLGGNVDE